MLRLRLLLELIFFLLLQQDLNVRRPLIARMREHVMLFREHAHAQTESTILMIAVVGIIILISKGCLFHDLTTAQAKPNVSKD